MKISILSDGAWGTALGQTLITNGHQVAQWGPFPDYIAEMAQTRENKRFLPGFTLSDKLCLTSDAKQALDGAELVILATPTQYLRNVLRTFKPFCRAEMIFVNVAKGIERESDLRVGQIVEQELGSVRYVALSGPSHAEEVIQLLPTAVVAASNNNADAECVQQAFISGNFRVYTSDDVIGVELGGALKNVMAIAAGIIDGMKLGDNPKAALMTRGITEMGRLGVALGGKAETFTGLSGVGDLIVTCCSSHSRNRHVGEELGRGKKLNQIISEMGMTVAEGVPTVLGAYDLARKNHAETPIINELYQVLYQDKSPKEAIGSLMMRSARPERDGDPAAPENAGTK